MKTKLTIAMLIGATFGLGVTAGRTTHGIHVHRPAGYANELGVYCDSGEPTVVGMEEKYLIVSCGGGR